MRKEFSNTEIYTDLTLKHDQMLGHRRICIRPTSMVLFKTGIRASNDIDNPYTRDSFFDFPVCFIRFRNMACLDKYDLYLWQAGTLLFYTSRTVL